MKPIQAIDLAYTGGLVDGEGCIRANRYLRRHKGRNPHWAYSNGLRIRFADEQTIKWLQKAFGIGCVYSESNGRFQTMWNWQVSGKECADVLLAIWPYLRTKRRQAQLIFQLRTCIETYKQPRDKRGRAMAIEPNENRLRLHLCEQISRLNQGLPEEGLDGQLPPLSYLSKRRQKGVFSEYVIHGLNGLSANFAGPSPSSSKEQPGKRRR